jgi:hypothetical protein
MDQDSYSKLMASSHKRHLKRKKNLQPQKWQLLLQQQQQQPRLRLRLPPAAASSNKSCYSLD